MELMAFAVRSQVAVLGQIPTAAKSLESLAQCLAQLPVGEARIALFMIRIWTIKIANYLEMVAERCAKVRPPILRKEHENLQSVCLPTLLTVETSAKSKREKYSILELNVER